jgi:microcystin-dependent protein
MFGGNFAPRGWALCDGQLLPISQNSALFSILGTTFGGDGRSNFGLPDLRGARVDPPRKRARAKHVQTRAERRV